MYVCMHMCTYMFELLILIRRFHTLVCDMYVGTYVCLYVCIYIYTYIYIYIYIHIHIYAYIYMHTIYIYIRMYVLSSASNTSRTHCIHVLFQEPIVHMCARVHIVVRVSKLHVQTWLVSSMHVCVSVYAYIYIYIHTYIHICQNCM